MSNPAQRPSDQASAGKSKTSPLNWLGNLADFLNFCIGYIDIRPVEVRNRLNDFRRLFHESRSPRFVDWLWSSSQPGWSFVPPPTPEEEKAALGAALAALRIFYDTPYANPPEGSLTPDRLKRREALRQKAIDAIQDRLNVFTDEDSETSVCDFGPLKGDDWNKLPSLARKLLRYMRGREQADLGQVFLAVWEKEYVAGKADVSAALNKVNYFLARRESKRTLHKRRGEGEIYWS
jgi:hypothetical protein